MKPKEIQEILEFIAQSGLEEVQIETEHLKLTTKRTPAAQTLTAPAPLIAAGPVASLAPAAPLAIPPASPTSKPEIPKAEAATTGADESKYKIIKSPMIGTFYRSPGPNEDAFVNVGDVVNVGTTVCIIEAMKLFNEIESEYAGKIVKILVQDASPVEYDQPLFVIDPS